MGFSFFRTIWITLRASNYTTRAFEDTIRGLKRMQREQLRFRMNAAKNIFAVGIMYVAFGSIAVGILGRIMAASKSGERVMERFGTRVGKSMAKLGDALARILGPILDVVAGILEFAMSIPFFKEFAAIVMVLATGFLLVRGATMMFTSAMEMLKVSKLADIILTKVQTGALDAWCVKTKVATVATYGFGQSLLFVGAGFIAAFAAVFIVYQLFGKMPAIILGVVIALVALLVVLLAVASVIDWTAGVRALAGAGIGGAIGAAAIASMPEHAMGTSFVRQGGLARVHAGEEIISAREKQIQPRWEKREFNRSFWNVNVNIGEVHTKADEETMFPLMKRALKESLDNK